MLRAGRLVRLTPTEYALLGLFTMHPDKLLTEAMLLEGVWGRARPASRHLLHVYIARLRKKLEPDPEAPSYLITEPGAGYRFATDSADTGQRSPRDARVEKIFSDWSATLTTF